MNLEFYRAYKSWESKGETKTNPRMFAENPPILQEAILVVAAKESKDVYAANQRAEGCGCNNCFKDAKDVKEWYGTR